MNDQQITPSPTDILIVDDALTNLRLLSQMLSRQGHKVRAVTSGERALEAVQVSVPDLILLDIVMPGMDGYEVCERLKADEQTRDIPVIFISALDATEDKVRAFAAGGIDYIPKPFQAAEVMARVKTHLALRELGVSLEAQIAARTAEIIAEKEKSETILRSVGDGIAVTDLEMRVEYVNEAFRNLTGYALSDIVGQSMYDLMAEKLPEQNRQSPQFLSETSEDWQGEVIVRCKDGHTYNAALIVAPVRDADGQLKGYVFSHRDISKLKNLDQARSQFVADFSHQLRTPVATLQLCAHLMRQKEQSEENKHQLEMMENEITHLIDLIRGILEIAKLGSGQAVTVWEPMSLSAVIGSVVTRSQSQAEAADLTLAVKPLPPDLPVVQGDRHLLTRVLEEIVENAIIFTPPGKSVSVETKATQDEHRTWVTISVQDTGLGISPGELDRIFDRFFRGSMAKSRRLHGTGLGLSIAQEIMHAHGGRITVVSQEGDGSTFTIWLPLAE
ncbi:MAG: response regulator [Chloroflexi bacterium]|nr:response regulator [Chloroflexota bacterium]